MQRRKFLAFMAAGPVAAKAAADKVALGHMGISTTGLADPIDQPCTSGSETEDGIKTLDWLRAHGIPEWRMEDIEKEAKFVRALDPDLACNKSMSLAAKIYSQRDRQLARLIDEETSLRMRNRARDAWLKKAGMSWWSW